MAKPDPRRKMILEIAAKVNSLTRELKDRWSSDREPYAVNDWAALYGRAAEIDDLMKKLKDLALDEYAKLTEEANRKRSGK